LIIIIIGIYIVKNNNKGDTKKNANRIN